MKDVRKVNEGYSPFLIESEKRKKGKGVYLPTIGAPLIVQTVAF